MTKSEAQTVVCQICHQEKRRESVLPAELLHPGVVETIRKQHPDWSPSGFICLPDLHHFRTEHVREILETERGELTHLEGDVVRSLAEEELLSRNVDAEFERELSFGERMADNVAEFGGSWTFVLSFGFVVVVWIAVNSVLFLWRPFDPFPYILLNLLLSCLAAVQAPIIMMSQNRQEARDRRRGENDYRVNLKAELEIRSLLAKMDQLLTHQWQRLLEIQQLQMEAMEELASRRAAGPSVQ